MGGRIMATEPDILKVIEDQLKRSSETVCRHIDAYNNGNRGEISQDILGNLRTLVEQVLRLKYAHNNETKEDWNSLQIALTDMKKRGEMRFISDFHKRLQNAVGHASFGLEDSERMMLSYIPSLMQIKKYVKDEFNINILENIDKYPLDIDVDLKEFYEKIELNLTKRNFSDDMENSKQDRYYIKKVKQVPINGNIIYEITITSVDNKTNKFERVICFSKFDISRNYSTRLWTVKDYILVLGKKCLSLLFVTQK